MQNSANTQPEKARTHVLPSTLHWQRHERSESSPAYCRHCGGSYADPFELCPSRKDNTNPVPKYSGMGVL